MMEIVFGFARSGPGTTLTHVAEEGRTLCGIKVPSDWYFDEWADGPECKNCKKVISQATIEERGRNMRYATDYLDGFGTRVIDTRDGGVVYDKLEQRAAHIICGLLNERDLPEPDEQDLVADCPHSVQEQHAHAGNPVCDECDVALQCGCYLPF